MKLPPFAKELKPNSREIWLYFGANPWPAAKYRAARRLPVLLLPPDQNPDAYRWSVSGREVLLIAQGQHDALKIPSFASALFRFGAMAVCGIYGDGQVVFYKRKSNDQAA